MYEELVAPFTKLVVDNLTIQPDLVLLLEAGIDRKLIKRLAMPLAYGLSIDGITSKIREFLHEELDNRRGVRMGQSLAAAGYGARLAMYLFKERLATPLAFTKLMQRVSRASEKLLEWTTPSGFKVISCQYVKLKMIEKGRVGGLMIYQPTGETVDQRWADRAAPSGLVHSLDAAVIHTALKNAPEGIPLAVIHDCVGTHPNHMEAFKATYRRAMSEVFSGVNPVLSLVRENNVQLEPAALKILNEKFSATPTNLVDGLVNSTYLLS
jgi:DNA-directed RNA polymerase